MKSEEFLKNVSLHKMQVLRDDGLYRHLRFNKGQSSVCWFDLITWPGNLCITGDMGTYAFSRIEDMFSFFRDERQKEGISINPGYWEEKVIASCQGETRKWSGGAFMASVEKRVVEYAEHHGFSDEDLEDLLADVLGDLEGDQDSADISMSSLCSYSRGVDGKSEGLFEDFEADCMEFTYRFLWCCYAIVWGIGEFQSEKDR